MRIRALLVAITASVGGGIEGDTGAVEVTVLVEGDSIDDCLDAGLNIELAAPLGERELIDGTTGEPVEVHPNADASIDR